MTRRIALCGGGAAALATLVAAFGVASTVRAAVPLPPDLAALEQQMAGLQANSERFLFQLEISTGELPGEGLPFVLLLTGGGESSDSPSPQASIAAGLLGVSPQQTRVIGNIVYRYQPQAAEVDGGRPWVSGTRQLKSETQGLDPSGVLESDVNGRQGTFSKLIEQLNGAQSIVESGPVTVENQRVTEFDAMLDPAPFMEKLRLQSKHPLHPLGTLFEEPGRSGEKAPAKPSPPPTLKLEAFIAPNGLPVRTRFTFTAEGTILAARVDTLAINVPVSVTAPPAAQTIGEAQLKAIEARRAKSMLRQSLRECRRLRGKRAAACRRTARLDSRLPRTSAGSLF
jgi:hypothetical protein